LASLGEAFESAGYEESCEEGAGGVQVVQ
jgi:hypothetical protein